MKLKILENTVGVLVDSLEMWESKGTARRGVKVESWGAERAGGYVSSTEGGRCIGTVEAVVDSK